MAVKVLLIDDDQEFLDILSERLTIRDMEVKTAASAKTGLDLVKNTFFDVIILDLQMPEMDGLQALEQLTAINPNLQIILLTGHATVARGVQAMKLGAVDVLEKPVNIRELVEKIRTTSTEKVFKSKGHSGLSSPTDQQSIVSRLFQSIHTLLKKNDHP
ncbi:response regulator [uncultured Desulfobulbus sp.]|uniref:response regulator n=1 Tax=uncultured Desulfobulbus sp. TaxID=239745 RepID=UPI0029C92BC8|nr:response regulator [uncultured Desulfobulbus sp.]